MTDGEGFIDAMRKRRQRSQSSPEYMQSPTLYDQDHNHDHNHDHGTSPVDIPNHSSTHGRARHNHNHNHNHNDQDDTRDRTRNSHGASGDDIGESSTSASASASGSRRDGREDHLIPGEREDSLTLRRREANRLAAQRFRSRKKGYQDSLEEKIRAMEDERDVLLSRLGEGPGDAKSPDSIDPVVRIAALESANRRLRDDLQGVREENDRLRDELEGWRRWRDERQPRALPPIDLGPPPSSYMQPPLERTRSFPAQPDVRLPPIRLPPLSPAISDSRSTPTYRPSLPHRLSYSNHHDDNHSDSHR